MKTTEQTVFDLVSKDTGQYQRHTTVRQADEAESTWRDLNATGSELWLDSGDQKAIMAEWNPCFSALTTNNSLLNAEIQKGVFDDFIPEAADALRTSQPDIDDRTLLREIAFVLNARHGLMLAQTFNAKVSVELHTDLAHDVELSVQYGRRIHAICPESFYVKVPFTPAGLLAARRLELEKVPVNLTLGFSVRQNYLAALFAKPHFVNVFMGRLNSFVDQSGLGAGWLVGEKTTLSTQRLLLTLRDAHQTPSRLIGASIRDASQLATLAGIDVMTMPPKVAAAYRKEPAKALTSRVGDDEELHLSLLPGFTSADFHGSSLWDMAKVSTDAILRLLDRDAETLTPADLLDHFEECGAGDFLPRWTKEEMESIFADGKIPDYKKWKEALRSRKLGLDALMNMAALGAFTADQQEFDDRISQWL